MPRNGSGTYSLPSGNPIDANSQSDSAEMNTTLEDLRDAMTASVSRDGQSPPTADMPWGTQKITALKDATGSADAANLKVIQNRIGVYCGTVGGTADAITLTPAPAIAALVAGQRFSFIAGGANTVAVTVNVSGSGVKSVTKRGTTALVAGDIQSGALISVEYDGTRFQIVSPIYAESVDSAIPATTVMLFFQAAAPVGWTQIASNNDKAIRVVSGTGGGTGGSVAFETAFASQAVAAVGNITGAHQLTIAEMPAHTHSEKGGGVAEAGFFSVGGSTVTTTGSQGGDGTHTHTWTGNPIDLDVQYINVIYCSKDA